jgi:hypothetical protein
MSIDASAHGDGVSAANASADPVDDLLDRATRRLRIDPELQREVRQELRTHLDDAIAELRRAGRGEADARAEAIAAMGDPDELAEQLWSSNRRRVRVRAAAAWAARLILPPLAVALIIVLGYGAVVSWALSGEHHPRLYLFAPPGHQQIRERYRIAAIADVSDQAKQLWALRDLPSEQRLAAARQLAERAPDDPALYAHYAGHALVRSFYTPTGDNGEGIPNIDEAVLRDMLAVLSEGERREPDNAFYPLLLAGVLFNASAVEP